MKSVFSNKENEPSDKELKAALGSAFTLWKSIRTFVREIAPDSTEEWKFTSEKFGWSYRISDKKRVIVYLLPRDKFFKVAFVFGQKATEAILKSEISAEIINELKSAKVYSEGRGIRLVVGDKSQLNDIRKLVTFKIAN
jgi:hypothetical protein